MFYEVFFISTSLPLWPPTACVAASVPPLAMTSVQLLHKEGSRFSYSRNCMWDLCIQPFHSRNTSHPMLYKTLASIANAAALPEKDPSLQSCPHGILHLVQRAVRVRSSAPILASGRMCNETRFAQHARRSPPVQLPAWIRSLDVQSLPRHHQPNANPHHPRQANPLPWPEENKANKQSEL